jgi:peptidoglycan/LPS O-acetylase OafA/YrhL
MSALFGTKTVNAQLLEPLRSILARATPAARDRILGLPRPSPRAGDRLAAVEGLRAYLAFWVLICHALWGAGYKADESSFLFAVLLNGRYAVEVFIIISGFVIFMLLDTRQETYWQFIIRRFFRLFPLFIVLFFIAIPISRLMSWNFAHASQYWTAADIGALTNVVNSWWANLYYHLPLHFLMLHGTVPQALLTDSPGAFLVPSWSVSVEWQFYLIAPLAYSFAVSGRRFSRLGLCALCVLLFIAMRKYVDIVNYRAALPFLLQFFFLGAASYFIYRQISTILLSDAAFPVCFTIALSLMLLGDRSHHKLVPIALWIAFFGLLLEPPSSYSSRLVAWLFTNRFVQFLGRISYSIYLSHLLIIVIAQYALLNLAPQLSRSAHFWALLLITFPVTIGASALLYRFLEAPGIQFGRSIARRLAPRGNLDCEVDGATNSSGVPLTPNAN